MQTATVLYMSHPTERSPDDRTYDENKHSRNMLEKLAQHLGEMRGDIAEIRTALKGNEFGTDGLVNRVEVLESGLLRVEGEVESLKRHAKNNRRIYKMAYTAGGALGLAALKYFMDKFFPSSIK